MTPKERHLAALARATHHYVGFWNHADVAAGRYAEIRSVVRAVLPGKQTNANTADAMDKAVKAVCRVIRRRA